MSRSEKIKAAADVIYPALRGLSQGEINALLIEIREEMNIFFNTHAIYGEVKVRDIKNQE